MHKLIGLKRPSFEASYFFGTRAMKVYFYTSGIWWVAKNSYTVMTIMDWMCGNAPCQGRHASSATRMGSKENITKISGAREENAET